MDLKEWLIISNILCVSPRLCASALKQSHIVPSIISQKHDSKRLTARRKKKSRTLNQSTFTRAKATILSRRELIRKSPSPSTGRLLQTSTDAHEPRRRRLILSFQSCSRKPSPCRHSISTPPISRHHRISYADCPMPQQLRAASSRLSASSDSGMPPTLACRCDGRYIRKQQT